MKNKTTIAILINDVDSGYHQPLCSAITEKCLELGLVPLFVVGGVLPEKDNSLDSTAMYNLLASRFVSGMIFTGTIFYKISHLKKRLCEFRQVFHDKPVVSISLDIENCSSILVDNRSGINLLLEHMTRSHSYKRFVFLTGPEHSNEAIERKQAVIEFFGNLDSSYNLSFWSGNFMHFSAYENAMEKLKDKNSWPDVILCANDESALGIFRACSDLKIRIPEDICITGFDDIEKSVYSVPALTTVHQPVYESGIKSVLIMKKMLEGYEMPAQQILPTSLVVRESCGCGGLGKLVHKNSAENTLRTIIKKVREELINEINDDQEFSEPARHIFKETARSFCAAIAGSKNVQKVSRHIRDEVFAFTKKVDYRRSFFYGFKKVLNSLETKIRSIGLNEDDFHFFNDVLSRAYVDLMQTWLKEEVSLSYLAENANWLSKAVFAQLSQVQSLDEFKMKLAEQIPRLGIFDLLLFYDTKIPSYQKLGTSEMKMVFCMLDRKRHDDMNPSAAADKIGTIRSEGLLLRTLLDGTVFRGFLICSMSDVFYIQLHLLASLLSTILSRFLPK